jgi:hypothetical protein
MKAGGKTRNQLAMISDYIGNRRKWKSGPQFPLTHLWDKMKPLNSLTTTKQTNRREEQEFRIALKMGGFTGPGRRQGLKYKGVLGRETTCKGEKLSE